MGGMEGEEEEEQNGLVMCQMGEMEVARKATRERNAYNPLHDYKVQSTENCKFL